MQFDSPPVFHHPFVYPPGYGYASPPPGGMPPRGQSFYEASSFSAQSIPTPAPSPRTPSHSRRRSTTHDFSGTAEYVSGKRPSSSRRSAHEHSEYSHEHPGSTASPRPSATHRGAPFMHTPMNTPPPSAHSHHPMPNLYSYGPGYTAQPQQSEYVSPSSRFYWSKIQYGFGSRSRPAQNYPEGYKSRHQRTSRTDYLDSQFHTYSPNPHHPGSPPPREGRRSRMHRRESTWAGESIPRSPPKTSKTAPPRTEPALDADAIRRKAAEHGIPLDYSLKNWNPNERPIILLGSVFDADSLGEWIFNWTKYHHGRHHEATKTAGLLWSCLVELSSKLKRAREFFGFIRAQENKEIVDDFMESGERLWQKLKILLKACEEYMWIGARGVASPKLSKDEPKTTVQMGKRSGAEFVEAMFGDKEWEKTERLLKGMATWCQRFEVNCEEILRRPDA
ncbi:hypothetical protein RUND412_004375 [Rhizina undulata]